MEPIGKCNTAATSTSIVSQNQPWQSCKIQEFVRNTQVLAFKEGSFYLISNFNKFHEDDHTTALRIYDTKSWNWSIPTIPQWRIYGIAGQMLQFKSEKKEHHHTANILYACGLDQVPQVWVPEWAVNHCKIILKNGKELNAFWSRKKAEIRDSNGDVIFQFDKYQVFHQKIENNDQENRFVDYVRENGIVDDFEIKDDHLILQTRNKASRLGEWKEYAICVSTEYVREGDNKDFSELVGKRSSVEESQNVVINLDEKVDKIRSVEKIVDSLVASSTQIDRLYRRRSDLKTLTSETKNWTAFWDTYCAFICDFNTGTELFSFKDRATNDRIDRIFFDGDLIGIIIYTQKLNQVESGFSYCSGPTVYDVDQEFRTDFRVLYFNIEGALCKSVVINDHKEFYDRGGYSPLQDNIIAVNGDVISKYRDGVLSFENLSVNIKQPHWNVQSLNQNNRFLVTMNFDYFNLWEGQMKVCSIPKPWSEIRLCGSYLAITRPTKEINIVNLENGRVEFEAQSEEAPKKICGFKYCNSQDDFLAVQYETYIQIWHRAHL